jgi:hypothetical protein
MQRTQPMRAAIEAGFLIVATFSSAQSAAATADAPALADIQSESQTRKAFIDKSASASTVASRATATTANTVYGGFELAASAVVYILVRGNSLGTLGVTQNFLDAPRVRVYDGQGRDLITDNAGRAGFNGCDSTASSSASVFSYYQSVRGQPPSLRDSCTSLPVTPGAYTFSVTPSVPGVTTTSTTSTPSAGEILFEVTLGPAGTAVETNRTRTERLIGGTWTFAFQIGSSGFSQTYSFTTIQASAASPGDYNAFGTDQFGDPIIGGYSTQLGRWSALDPSILLDRYYTFDFSDLNHISGCYYQVTPSGSTNLGSCYPMNGIRTPFKSVPSNEDTLDDELAELAAAQAQTGSRSGLAADPAAIVDMPRISRDLRSPRAPY